MGLRQVLGAGAAALLLSGSAALATTSPSLPAVGFAISKPHVLSAADVRRYKRILEDERSGRFKAARKLVAELDDRCLIGYVTAEHLLSPHSGHASPKELNDWLREHGDLSIAPRIRDLSERRTRRKGRIPAPPAYRWRGGGYESGDTADPPPSSPAARAVLADLKDAIQHDQPDVAMDILTKLKADPAAPADDIARLSHDIANSYLAEGMDQKAYDLADSAAVTGRKVDPLLDWSAGIAAYRLGRFDDSAQHFSQLAQAKGIAGWTRSAAAFWSARAYLNAGEPRAVVSLLTVAAREEPTFYGLLAERILGLEPDSEFRNAQLTTGAFETLMQNPAAHRAVAAWQIGEEDWVPNEMNRAFAGMKGPITASFAALAKDMDLPNVELRASETEAAHGDMLTGLFPVPDYAPDGGYRVDPSVLLALARVESRFEPDAISSAGARGLMQLMPSTAKILMGHPVSDDDLSDPKFNLMLGQRYVERLLKTVNNNLFELAAAYDAGPGNLMRWRGLPTHDDPLLFIESLPSPETRSYIKRFMMYHWLYRRRLEQDSPTLDATAKGGWPIYTPQQVPVASVPRAVRSFDAAAND